MKRVVFAALLCAGAFCFSIRPASATTEFCPARLAYAPVRGAVGESRNIYGADLWAFGPRSVRAQIAFDTDSGWYTVDVPKQTLIPTLRHYTAPSTQFVKTDWVSPRFYVRFGKPVAIRRAWVASARSEGDGFGWSGEGIEACLPPGTADWEAASSTLPGSAIVLDSKDRDRLDSAPDAEAVILAPQPSKPLGDTSCAQPFRAASIVAQARPNYPDNMRMSSGMQTVGVDVAVNAEGRVADAWVWASSGYQPLDDAALNAAKSSTYQTAIAYCQNVPGLYLFRITFVPN